MDIQTFIVDAFTDQPFRGNPAAICLLDSDLDDEQMQQIASEFNLSETAFLRASNASGDYNIRFFSPLQEIPLCGHATLGAAHVLFKLMPSTELNFLTRQGLNLVCNRSDDKVLMKFPLYDSEPREIPSEMLKALGIQKINGGCFAHETSMLLIEIKEASELVLLTPDYEALKQSYSGIDGVIVTVMSDNTRYDFYSRYFWPWAGGNEDPVTGAAYTVLSKYWMDRLKKKKMRAYQASKRGGILELEVTDASSLNIIGSAVTVHTGKLHL